MLFAHRKLFLFLVTFISISSIETYRILGVFPFNAKSHNVMFNALMNGLAKRGHQVDDITHMPVKNASENYKVLVNLDGSLDKIVSNFTMDFASELLDHGTYFIAGRYGNEICKLLGLEEVQRVIRSPPNDPPYDLVITEVFGARCFMGLGYVFKVPLVAVASVDVPWINDMVGDNDNEAFVSSVLLQSFNESNFLDRLKNFVSYKWNKFMFYSQTGNIQTDLMRKYLSPNIPDINEIEKNVALTIMNTDPIMFGLKPVSPSLIQVGGLHLDDFNETLPAELKKWLDNSENGVVYFTFGSLVLVESLPVDTLQAIFTSFSKIAPTRVLIKITDKKKLPLKLPTNVRPFSWVPQQAVLGHKNIRAFITHGGLLSCQEAWYHGVPLIGIPLYGDQPRNIGAFVQKQMAVKIDFKNITTDSLDLALNQILTNPRYRENARLYSRLFRDKPVKRIDKATYWIEYVIRNGPNSLRSPALKLRWWQIELLDVYGLILLMLALTLYTVYCLTKLLLRIRFVRSTKKVKNQ